MALLDTMTRQNKMVHMDKIALGDKNAPIVNKRVTSPQWPI